MFGLGGPEIFVIVVVALVLLGPQRLPPLARAAGRGYREFMRVRRQVDATIDELKRDIELDLDDPAPEPRPAAGTQPRVPLDQLHAVAPEPRRLHVPPTDDYLAAVEPDGEERADD